jgi:hypothetical protein
MLRLSLLVITTLFFCAIAVSADMEAGGAGLWFPVGETLDYRIYWGVIPVGSSHVTTEWIQEDGRTLIAIRFRTRSNNVLSKMYPVDDTLEAIIDPETFLPTRFTKKLNEGRYRADETTCFDHKNLKATWTSRLNHKVEEYQIDPDTRDIVTFMYYMRRKQFEPDTVTKYRVMADDKIYDLIVKAQGMELVSLDHYGKLSCLRFEPEAKFGGLFVRKGRMWMWVSQDSRRIATKISARVPVGSITLWLDQVGGSGEDFWVMKGKKQSATSEVKQ